MSPNNFLQLLQQTPTIQDKLPVYHKVALIFKKQKTKSRTNSELMGYKINFTYQISLDN